MREKIQGFWAGAWLQNKWINLTIFFPFFPLDVNENGNLLLCIIIQLYVMWKRKTWAIWNHQVWSVFKDWVISDFCVREETLKLLIASFEIQLLKSHPEMHQLLQFERVYSYNFPDILIWNSEIWVCIQCKQRTWLNTHLVEAYLYTLLNKSEHKLNTNTWKLADLVLPLITNFQTLWLFLKV